MLLGDQLGIERYGGLELDHQIILRRILLKIELFREELASERDGGLEGKLKEYQETKEWEREDEEEESEIDVSQE